MRVNKRHLPELYLQTQKEMAFGNHWCYINIYHPVFASHSVTFFKSEKEALADKRHRDWVKPSCLTKPFETKLLLEQMAPLVDKLSDKFKSYGPMELHIDEIEKCLTRFAPKREEMDRERYLNHWSSPPLTKKESPVLKQITTDMNTENLEYLQKQVFYAGFGEGLNTQLERKLKEGDPDFQLKASHEFGKDQMEAVLYFSRSKQEDSDKYFFNKYDAMLSNSHGNFQQTFFINNKGQSITFKEACNLLNGRSVYKELTPKEGARYKAWVKLDFNKRDEYDNAKLSIFNAKYGFDLKEALGRVPLKEANDPEKMAALFVSLEKGNLAAATLMKTDKEIPVQIAADPKFKTIRMFDSEGAKLYVPGPKQEVQYGQAPSDAKRTQDGEAKSIGEHLNEQNLNAKQKQNQSRGPGLLEKKERNKSKANRIV